MIWQRITIVKKPKSKTQPVSNALLYSIDTGCFYDFLFLYFEGIDYDSIELCKLNSKADIRNPLRYLLMNAVASRPAFK